MMTRWVFVCVAVTAVILAGCPQDGGGEYGAGPEQATAPRPVGLSLQVSASSTALTVGQEVTFQAVATNRTDQAIDIVSSDSGLCIFRIWRHTVPGWTETRRFPEMYLTALHPWTLPPGEQRTFTMPLTVGPDWRSNEPLRLTAELNGYAVVSQPIEFFVTAPAR